MSEVVSSIKRVQDIMGEITAASREQTEGIEQVNQAVMQMDQVTQQNAALVEEAAAAAEAMQDQAAHQAGCGCIQHRASRICSASKGCEEACRFR